MIKTLKQRLSENKRLKYELFSLFEQEDPSAQPGAIPPGPPSPPPPQTATGMPPTQDPNAQQQDPNQQKPVPQVDETGEPIDQIISAINIIRSGRSFKDAPVKIELEKYMNDLNDQEKGILITFLKGLSQVASGQIPGEQAIEPEDVGSYRVVSMKKGSKITVKSSGGTNNTSSPPSQEDTTAPAPIAPKQR